MRSVNLDVFRLMNYEKHTVFLLSWLLEGKEELCLSFIEDALYFLSS